jgi:hypothetical protein
MSDQNNENECITTDPANQSGIEPKKQRVIFKSKKTNSFVNRKQNQSISIDFNSMTHEQLVAEATRLHTHVKQLKNLLDKAKSDDKDNISLTGKTDSSENIKSNKKERAFDFSKFNKRHVLLKFAYLGWSYQARILHIFMAVF